MARKGINLFSGSPPNPTHHEDNGAGPPPQSAEFTENPCAFLPKKTIFRETFVLSPLLRYTSKIILFKPGRNASHLEFTACHIYI
jgi:hypothetical protein